MFGLDEWIAELGADGSVLAVAFVAILLGLRHATDPDHLAAVSALIAGDEKHGGDTAGRLGLAWGAGHATTLTLLGIPIVVLDAYLPELVQIGTETLIGVLIMALAIRLLVRWRRGYHAHPHRHGEADHVHLHRHAQGSPAHDHAHQVGARSVRGAYGVGLVHGVGGSAGIGVLLLAAIPDSSVGIAALVLFAGFTAVSMGCASYGFGRMLAGGRMRRRAGAMTPALGVFNFAFGAWYALGALGAVPYVF